MEREEKYMKEIEHHLTDCSDKEKIKILMQKLHYWVKSARNWERLNREARKEDGRNRRNGKRDIHT